MNRTKEYNIRTELNGLEEIRQLKEQCFVFLPICNPITKTFECVLKSSWHSLGINEY